MESESQRRKAPRRTSGLIRMNQLSGDSRLHLKCSSKPKGVNTEEGKTLKEE